jgi:hypothetical protein
VKRARHWYHARWIAINVAVIAASAWVYAYVLIPRFITRELTVQAADLVRSDYDGSAPKSAPADGRVTTLLPQTSPAAPSNRTRLQRDRPRQPREEPRPAYANPSTVSELGGVCVAGRVFRSKVTNGVTEITEVADIRC